MCHESLKEVLKTKFPETMNKEIDDLVDKNEERLNFPDKMNIISEILKLKILDPACGSGAFPMGMFMLMVHSIEKLQEHKTTYKNKLDIITHCIYGIDIQNIAIEISKLRFFISLLVDYQTPERIEDFEVLPNLETKFVVANTLIGINLQGKNLFEHDLLTKCSELTVIFMPFTQAKTPKEKTDIKNAFEKKKNELVSLLTDKHCGYDEVEKIRQWNPFNVCYCSPFFDSAIMFGINEGFDIVIGNPPYVQLQNNGGVLATIYENCSYKTFARTGDLYSLFYERGWQLLKTQGRLCFITSNKWMRSGYGENTRKFFIKNTNPELLIDFAGVKVFESATVDVNILMFSKDKNIQKTKACIIKKDYKDSIKDLGVYFKQNSVDCNFSTSESWVILNPIEQRIKAKIEAVGIPLRDWDINIYRGVLTGCNEAFIIDKNKKDELIAADPKSAEIIRPILRGRDIKRYGYEFADLWLINTHNGIRGKGIKPIDINDYPAIKKHLDNYWDQIEHRADQGDTPYNLRNCAYMEDFYKQKIMYPNMTKFMPFYLDNKGFFQNDKSFMITGEKLYFLVAFLNSSLFKYCFIDNFPKLGDKGRELRKIFFDKISIIKVNHEIDELFKPKILEIQELKKQGLNNKNKEIEIDNMIFDLYGLTIDEKNAIGFIEIE
jgi:hypothetical protein